MPTLSTPSPQRPLSALRGDILLYLGLTLTLLPQLLRATSNSTPFPFWDQDPLIYSISAPALTPADSILIDAATLLGAAILFLRALRHRIPINLSLTLLAIIGALPIILHGWFLSPTGFSLAWSGNGSLNNQRIGASWLSAIFAALAIWHAAQDLRVRRILAGTLLGFIALLACYGAAQVYFIHAQTMADFQTDPDKFLAAHGWSRDSSMAKSFIRRISQPEASAWFGLANVYATFAAAALAAGVFFVWDAMRNRRGTSSAATITTATPNSSNLKFQISNLKSETSAANPAPRLPNPKSKIPIPKSVLPNPKSQIPLLLLFSLLSALALFLAHSKGGTLAFAGALIAVLALFLLSRRAHTKHTRTLAALIGLAAIIAPILLILIRGHLSEHALNNERSLLFRSFYADASIHIFADHPLLGVGPDGFQRAFTIAKPPLCPEEVLSPHCIPLDYLADLGILGLAWILLLARFAIYAAHNVLKSASTPETPTPKSEIPNPKSEIGTPKSEISNLKFKILFPRNDTRLLLALPTLATLLATFLETPYITPDLAVVRIGGLILWCLCAYAIARAITNSRFSQLALTAAALAALAHAQIDVVASFPLSAPLWLMLIATAAALSFSGPNPAPNPNHNPPRSPPRLPAFALPGFVLCLSALLFTTSLSRTRSWQNHLEAAALTVRPIAEITERLNTIAKPPIPGERATDSIEAITRDLRTLTGNPSLQPTPAAINGAIFAMRASLLPPAAESLERAFAIYPDNRLPLREASRLHLQLAQIALDRQRTDEARTHFDRAISVLHILPTASPTIPDPSGPELQWLASIYERRAIMLTEPTSLPLAIQHRLALTAVDPYNLDNALKLFRNYEKLADTPEAKRWASRTLELHEYTRLDRETRGLSPADLAEVQNSAKAAPPR